MSTYPQEIPYTYVEKRVVTRKVDDKEVQEVQEIKHPVTIRILEVIPYRDGRGKQKYLVCYQIVDGGWESPRAHFWYSNEEEFKEKLKEIVEYYFKIRDIVRRL